MCIFALAFATACEDPQQTQTEAFESAEARYRTGKYNAALDGYEAFLDAYPRSPLAKTAELRIRCIHREVRSVLMRKDMPRPDYVRAAEEDDDSDLPEVVQ